MQADKSVSNQMNHNLVPRASTESAKHRNAEETVPYLALSISCTFPFAVTRFSNYETVKRHRVIPRLVPLDNVRRDTFHGWPRRTEARGR